MGASLHVFKDELHIAEFDLQPGSHLLGIGDNADLLLSDERVSCDVCYVDVDNAGQTKLLALPNVDLRDAKGDNVAELMLTNGRFAESAGLTLTLVRQPDLGDVQVDAPRTVPVTVKSKLLHAPPADTLALLVTTTRGYKLVELDRPTITIGRDVGNTVRIAHEQVSARHVEIAQTASGPWLKDLTSLNGTFLNGAVLASGAFPKGGRVHLSPAADAPVIELLTRAEALARIGNSGAMLQLVGSSAPMQRFRELVARYGPLEQPVLILGETGTGKELTARSLAEGRGKDKPFIVFNCGDLERELAGSELFGHVKGAFTGAIRDRMGHFESAGYGTLFLDELGDLPLDLQTKLLRVLDNGTIQRRGESRERDVHCRIIAATNRDLLQMLEAGTFRRDLYERLARLVVQAPPLRERLADLPELAHALLGRMRGDGEGKVLSPGALARLAEHDWKGNVRELSNVLQRAAIHTQGIEIPPSAIVLGGPVVALRETTAAADSMASEADRRLIIERNLCQQALDEAGGSIRQAARNLGKSITSFRRRLVTLGIRAAPQSAPAPEDNESA